MTQSEQTTTTTRRSFLSAAAATAVLPAGALAQTDPIFAAIERHRAAFKEFAAASLANDTVAAKKIGRQITQADNDRLDAAQDADLEAAELVASTAPTTMAGLAAALVWLLEYDHGCIPDTTIQFLETLATSPLITRS